LAIQYSVLDRESTASTGAFTMSEAKPYQPPEWQQPPASKGSSLKWLMMGCGGLILVCLVLCAGGTFWAYSWVNKQVSQVTEEFEAKGYEKQMGQVIEVNQSPAKKTVYASQVLKINKDVDVDLAVVCQMMEVNADIHGDVDFLGQVMKVNSGAVIDGDLRVKNAQVIEIHGEVKGKITGNYMVLNYKGKSYSSGQSPSDPEEKTEIPEGKIPVELEMKKESAKAPEAPPAPEAPQPPVKKE
jgi:hypothetical protein